MHVNIIDIKIHCCSNRKDENNQTEQKKQIKSCIPPTRADGGLLTQLLDPPMVLMIQTELCEKKTLKNWLLDHIYDRKRRTVVNFFEQVHSYIYMYNVGYNNVLHRPSV